MATAATVSIDFAAETAKFTAELKRVNASLKSVEGSVKQVERSFESFNTVVQRGLRIATGAAFLGFAKSALQAADATADAAARAGLAVETFSRLQYAATLADADLGALTTGIQRFQVVMDKATTGNVEAIKTLQQFRLTAKDLSGVSIEEQLGRIADEFAKIEDPARRTRLAVELFGKSAGPALLPLLEQGRAGLFNLMAEADRLGITLSSETAKAIDQTDAAIKRLTQTALAWGSKVVAGLSVLILGPPEKALEIDNQLTKLIERRASLARNDVDAVSMGAEKTRQAIAALDKEITTLTAKYWAEVDKAGKAKSAAEKARLDAASGVLFDTSKVEEISLDALRKEREKVDELAEAYKRLEETVAVRRASYERWQQMADQVNEAYIESQSEFQTTLDADLEKHLAYRHERAVHYANETFDKETEAATALAFMKEGLLDSGLNALQAFAGESENVARALVLINKAQAVQQAIQNTAVAVTAAMALGPAGLPMAAMMKALGAAQVALILATGYGQMRQIGAHGGAPIGSPVNPVHTQPEPVQAEPADSGGRTVQVIVNGNLFSTRETVDYLVNAIRGEIDNKDVVLFSPSSRQAQEIREAG